MFYCFSFTDYISSSFSLHHLELSRLLCFLAETNLLVEKSQSTEIVINKDTKFNIPCNFREESSHESQFQVTWFWHKDAEIEKPKAIFTAYRNSTLQSSFEKGELIFDHPEESKFSLTVLKPSPEHSGLYFCEVEQWLQSLPEKWRTVSKKRSEDFNVTVLGDGKHSLI